MRLALYQPDIPQNTGTILRMAACFGLPVDIIRPTGFDISDKALRRSVMDYRDALDVVRHDNWAAFSQSLARQGGARIVAVTTQSLTNYTDHLFNDQDVLLFGRDDVVALTGFANHVELFVEDDRRLAEVPLSGRV